MATTTQTCITGSLAPYSAWGANNNSSDADLSKKRDIQHLFNRMTFGAHQADIAWALSKTPSQVVDTIVDLAVGETNVPAPGMDVHKWADKTPFNDTDLQAICGESRWGALAIEWTDGMIGNNSFNDPIADQEKDRAKRFKYKMGLFWHNHFVTDRRTYQGDHNMMWYKYTLIYNAVGNFKTFVQDIGLCQAMIHYLNTSTNWYNHEEDWEPNENYARELLELFTMGATTNDACDSDHSNYSICDIEELAKVFSGWEYEYWSPTGAKFREYYFQPNLHYWGPKTFFGETITPVQPTGINLDTTAIAWPQNNTDLPIMVCDENGVLGPLVDLNGNVAYTFLEHRDHELVYFGDRNANGIKEAYDEYEEAHDIIFGTRNGVVISPERQQTIARFICGKLYKELVYQEIDEDIVNQLATTFINNNWELAPVLKQLLKSEHFYNAAAHGAQIKSHMGAFFSLYTSMGAEHMVDHFPQPYAHIPSSYLHPDDPYGYWEYQHYTVPYKHVAWGAIWHYVRDMGHNLFEPPNVAGWPGHRKWINEYSLYKMGDVLAECIATDFNNPTTTYEKWRQLMIDLSNNSSDPTVVTKAVAEHFIMVDLLPEQLEAATCAFKEIVPVNYFEDGIWNLYYDAVPQQFINLMSYLVRQPEFFMA